MAKMVLIWPKNNLMEEKDAEGCSGKSIEAQSLHHHRPDIRLGRATALELAEHGTVVLVGRDRKKLDEVQKVIEKKGQHAVSVVCDLSDIASVKNAAKAITELHLPIVGLINNAGIYQIHATKNAMGWDMTFATNHLGPSGAQTASSRRRERRLRLLRRGRPRTQTRCGGRFSRRSLYLCGGQRAR
jgi:NAD(P)-dependent dehydrogenase (short-subunit alcohol dehydrogenase family)